MSYSINNQSASPDSLPFGIELDVNGSMLVTPKQVFLHRVQSLLSAAGDHSLGCLPVQLSSRLEKNFGGLRFVVRAGTFAISISLTLRDTSERTALEAYYRLAQHEVLIVSAVSHDIAWGGRPAGQAQPQFGEPSPRLSVAIRYEREIYLLTATEFDSAAEAVAKTYSQLRTAVMPYV